MKRTLFLCCVLLTALAVPLLSARTSRAEAGCGTTVEDPNGIGHCAVPGIYADTYGDCFWEDDDCDRANHQTKDAAAVVTATDTVCDEDVTDYWYDGETGEYYDYEFGAEDVTVAETITETAAETTAETAQTTAATEVDTVDTAEEALDDLFEICETEVATTDVDKAVEDTEEETTADCTGTADSEDDYRCDYGCDCDYGYDYEAEYDYAYEEYEDYEYEGSYEDDYDYDYACDDYAYWNTYACDEADATVDQKDEEADWMYVEDGLDYRDESYVEQVCQQGPCEAEAPADDAATTVQDEVAEEAWQDDAYDYYAESGDYGYDYGYDYAYDYAYGYDTEAHEYECQEQVEYEANEVASGAEEAAAEGEAPVVNEAQAAASPHKLQREAVLSLARTLNRIGTSLQKISQTLTDMAAHEVAVQTTGDTVER